MHCGQYVSRKQETEHRKLAIAPYTASPPRLPSRLRRVFDVEPDDDPQLLHDNEQDADGSFSQDIHADSMLLSNSPTSDTVDDLTNVLQSAIHDRWSHATMCEDSDSDIDIESGEPLLESSEDQIEDQSDDDYIEWDAIGSDSGLSAWDQLGEGYERDAASIGEHLDNMTL